MNSRISRLGVLVLLLAVLLAPAIVAAQEAATPPQPRWPETEPNDDFYEANDISLNRLTHGRINPVGDIDTYRLFVYDPMLIIVEMRLPESSPLVPTAALYDGSQNLLEQRQCPRSGPCLTYQTQAFDSLYVVVSGGQGAAGPAHEYSLIVMGESEIEADPNEPNDFLSEATPYTIGQTMVGRIEPEGDIDTFVFHLDARDEVQVDGYDLNTRFLDADGELLHSGYYDRPVYLAPESGTYYLQIVDGPQAYEFALRYIQRPIYASFGRAGKLDGVAFKPGDILVYTSLDDTWRMWFRAADHGLKGNLVAFDRDGEYSPTSLYMAFGAAQRVPGVGLVAPHDVLSYYPGNPDWGDEPSWSLSFDGSQVGLTTSSERLDALAVGSNCCGTFRHYLSTSGKAQLLHGGGQWHIANNDVMAYEGYLENGRMSGYYSAVLSGQAGGFGRANVVGLDVDDEGRYLSFDRNLTLDGVAFAPGDIAYCTRQETYGNYGCDRVIKIFDASEAGVGGYKIDAIDVGVYEMP